MFDPQRYFDKQVDILDDELANGMITTQEYNEQVRELERDYREMADQAAQDAYEDERSRW